MTDADGDGWGARETRAPEAVAVADCDDADPALSPGAEDVARAGRWAIEELCPHLPRMVSTLQPIAPLA